MSDEKQILVVEDEIIVGMDIQRRLKNLGYIGVQSHKGTKPAMKNNRIPIGQANCSVCSLPFLQHF